MSNKSDNQGGELNFDGTDLSKAGLPANLENEVRGLGYSSVESIYGSMVGAPEVWKPYLQTYGLDYDELLKKLRALIPPPVLEELDKPVRPFPLGALDPKDAPPSSERN